MLFDVILMFSANQTLAYIAKLLVSESSVKILFTRQIRASHIGPRGNVNY